MAWKESILGFAFLGALGNVLFNPGHGHGGDLLPHAGLLFRDSFGNACFNNSGSARNFLRPPSVNRPLQHFADGLLAEKLLGGIRPTDTPMSNRAGKSAHEVKRMRRTATSRSRPSTSEAGKPSVSACLVSQRREGRTSAKSAARGNKPFPPNTSSRASRLAGHGR
jgi:hypothetical protein